MDTATMESEANFYSSQMDKYYFHTNIENVALYPKGGEKAKTRTTEKVD